MSSVYFDLHSHSTASDGVLKPSELVERAARKGVKVLALTDHDVVDGIDEAIEAARCHGLTLIPGVEISVDWNRTLIHVVGLDIDHKNLQLTKGLDGLRQKRDLRAVAIGKKFEKLGIMGVYEGARRYASGKVISRTHFSRYLVDAGVVKNQQVAFKKYLMQGKPCYVSTQWVELEQAIEWIREAGGEAVIAHPARYRMTNSKMLRLIDDFVKFGGRGIEVATSSHTKVEREHFAQIAQRYQLLASLGSDFHTPEAKYADLGSQKVLPDNCNPIWNQWHVEKCINFVR